MTILSVLHHHEEDVPAPLETSAPSVGMNVQVCYDYDCDGVFVSVRDPRNPAAADLELSGDPSEIFEMSRGEFWCTYLVHADEFDQKYWFKNGYYSGRAR